MATKGGVAMLMIYPCRQETAHFVITMRTPSLIFHTQT